MFEVVVVVIVAVCESTVVCFDKETVVIGTVSTQKASKSYTID